MVFICSKELGKITIYSLLFLPILNLNVFKIILLN